MRPRYAWWKLLLLAVFLVGTFVLMVWFVTSYARESRGEMERRKAQENAQHAGQLRDSFQPTSHPASPAPGPSKQSNEKGP